MVWMPLSKYCHLYPWPTISTLRWMVWKVELTLGTQAPFIHRYGKRVLIDADKFQAWIESEDAHALRDKWVAVDREVKKRRKEAKQALSDKESL